MQPEQEGALDLEDFESLLEEAMEVEEEEAEDIVISVPDFDPVMHIAEIFEKQGNLSGYRRTGEPLLDLILANLPNAEEGNLPASQLQGIHSIRYTSLSDIAAIGISTQLARQRKIEHSLQRLDHGEDDILNFVRSIGSYHIKNIEMVLALEAVSSGNLSIERKSRFDGDVQGASAGERPDRLLRDDSIYGGAIQDRIVREYQKPMFQGYKPEALVLAGIILPLLDGTIERLVYIDDKKGLMDLVALNLCRKAVGREVSAKIKKQIDDPGSDLGALVEPAFLMAASPGGKIAGMELHEAQALYRKIVDSRKDYISGLARRIHDEKQRQQHVYPDMADDIVQKLKGEGMVFNAPGLRSESGYEKFKKDLLEMKLAMFRVKDENPKELRKDMWAMTAQALDGERYSCGRRLRDLPLGTIGRFDYDLDFMTSTASSTGGLKASEVVELEKIDLTIPPEAGKRKAEIIEGSRYTYSKEGSWGYIVGESSDTYSIEFHHISTNHRTPVTWPIQKSHVKVTLLDKKKHAALAEKLEKEKEEIAGKIKKSIASGENKYKKELVDKESEILKAAIEDMRSAGISDALIRYFIESSNVSLSKLEGASLPERDIFREMNDLLVTMSPDWMKHEVLRRAGEKTGLFFRYDPKIKSAGEFERFKKQLSDLELECYKLSDKEYTRNESDDIVMTVSAADGDRYSDGTLVSKVPIGTIGVISRGFFYNKDTGDHHEISAKEMKKLERFYLIKDKESYLGDKVEIIKNNIADLRIEYIDDRNRNYPIGSVGVCAKMDRKGGAYIRFGNRGNWSLDWRSDDWGGEIDKDIGHFSKGEFRVIPNPEEEKEREKIRKDMQKQLGPIIAEVEKEFEKRDVISKIEKLAHDCVSTLLSFGYDTSRIKRLMKEKLVDYSYFEMKGYIPDSHD